MSVKEEYQKKLQAQLDEWGPEIDKLKAVADKAKTGLQGEYYKEIEDLRSKQQTAQKKLHELKGASGEAWGDLKEGIETAWGTLGDALKLAASRFK
ncbi:MAG: coiled coil domain-containing protein [Nitrospinae bacterium]|nr:coiled coil domain-containing protein [Nitrospinota bacterium]